MKLLHVLVASVPLLLSLPALAGDFRQQELDNGLEVILKESHGGPMVASIVTVGAGARWEDEASYGASHYLEHMLFDGTASRSREDINEGIKDYGGYINAFTRREYTCFILLIPSEYLREGLEIQADMLYGSTLPPHEWEKERLIVLEEMRKDMDSGRYGAEVERLTALLGETPYSHPVLGTFETIEAISREQVYDYYRRQYVPANSRLFLVGDFEPRAARRLLEKVFGRFDGPAPPPPAPVSVAWPAAPELTVLPEQGGRPSIDLVWRAPGMESGDYPAQLVLASLLSDEHRSPLGDLDASAGVELFEGFSLFTLSVDPGDEDPGAVLERVGEALKVLPGWAPDPGHVADAAYALRVEDAFLLDTYHYFAMMKSAELHLGGFPYLDGYRDALRSLDPAALRGALERSVLAGPPRVLLSDLEGEAEGGILEGLVLSPAPVQLAEGLAPPARSESRDRGRRRPRGVKTARETLDNGLTLLVKSDPSSEVFAAHLLVRGRSLMEPSGRAGAVDVMQSLLDAGTRSHEAEELAALEASLGLKMKVSDNPWIPFDDYYSREDFSFIRMEVLDEKAPEALAYLAELLTEATFPEPALERERGKRMGALARGGDSPADRARAETEARLFDNPLRGRPVGGSARDLAPLTVGELRDLYAVYYDPRRMVLSVVTGRPLGETLKDLRRSFAGLEAAGPELPASGLNPGPAELSFPMDKEQVALRATRLLPPAPELDESMSTLVSILSARMGLELREKQGLAYSIGAGLRSVPGLAEGERGFSQLSLAMATSAGNREAARRAMEAELRRMVDEPPTSQEVFRAVNGRWGRLLMRNLSRIHQAYGMGLAEHLGQDPFAPTGGKIDHQREVSSAALAHLAEETLLKDDWVWVLAGGGLEE